MKSSVIFNKSKEEKPTIPSIDTKNFIKYNTLL
jgi:hypothetical protein